MHICVALIILCVLHYWAFSWMYWVGKWVPASAGKAKAGMVYSISEWMRGVQVKLWDPLRKHAIPERLRGVLTMSRYTNSRLPLPFTFTFTFTYWQFCDAWPGWRRTPYLCRHRPSWPLTGTKLYCHMTGACMWRACLKSLAHSSSPVVCWWWGGVDESFVLPFVFYTFTIPDMVPGVTT